jgi:hypothetical protein
VLRQAANIDLYRLRVIQAPNPLGRKDVDHSRRKPAVRNDRYVVLTRRAVELLLFEDDLSVAPEASSAIGPLK